MNLAKKNLHCTRLATEKVMKLCIWRKKASTGLREQITHAAVANGPLAYASHRIVVKFQSLVSWDFWIAIFESQLFFFAKLRKSQSSLVRHCLHKSWFNHSPPPSVYMIVVIFSVVLNFKPLCCDQSSYIVESSWSYTWLLKWCIILYLDLSG